MAGTDPFSTQNSPFNVLEALCNAVTPAQNVAVASFSDTVDFAVIPRAIMLGTAGNLKVNTQGGQTGVTLALPAGIMIPVRVTRIYATGSDAVTVMLFW